MQDAVEWASWATYAVAVGEIDSRTCHEIGYMINAFKGAVDKADLERKIDEQQKVIAELRKLRSA